LGEFSTIDGKINFIPVVPFTRGMHYHIIAEEKIIAEFTVPADTESKNPNLTIFPSQDTLPENILKMYLVFTEPMVEGQSLLHIHLLNNNGDTLSGTFLDLQPELWNEKSTTLTLWLDPGRIKRDLIPNKILGNPLTKGETLMLHVSENWKSKTGLKLNRHYSKTFFVDSRDEQIPSINLWTLSIPTSTTTSPLVINFSEPLDFSLTLNTLQLLDENEKVVLGKIELTDEEKGIVFLPLNPWKKGNYKIKVESRLEDLAGNNLSRPFDKDLKKKAAVEEKDFYERAFVVE